MILAKEDMDKYSKKWTKAFVLTYKGSFAKMVEVFDFKVKGETLLQTNYVCYSLVNQYLAFQATFYRGKAKNFNLVGVFKINCYY
mmetsp:Transcript_14101/g.23948  ORF Transcript_14101/g.23948 Transcript_14101/m.23948 type:complete len:85 (+) Transcript_14101:215-469(+)